MAKRKLSEEQRGALRKELAEAVATGTRKTDIYASLGRKYGISPVTVAWYLNGGKRAGNGRRRGPGRPRGSGKARATTGRKGAPRFRLLEMVNQLSERALRRALQAKKLLPRLESLLRRERRLAERARATGRALRSARTRRKGLQRKIARLAAAR